MKRIFRSSVEGLPQPLAKEFAQKWAEYCGARYALLLPHGTDALRIALAAALDHDGIEYGGEVIVPNLTFIASATAALDRRLGVALVDVEPTTLNLDPRRVEEAIIPGKTRAIMAVHLFGHPADMAALRDIARRHSLALIEDAAQAHGAIHELGRAGSLGDAAGFSFQSSKNLSCGEGGAFTTNDLQVFDRAYAFHDAGRARNGGQRWGHETVGWNYRASEYVAAVLLHRFQTLEAEQQRRYTRFLSLRRLLSAIGCVEPLGLGPGVQRHGVHMFVMRYRPEKCAGLAIEDFLHAMQAEGIPLYRAYEATLTQQPALERLAQKHPGYLRVLPTPIADQAVKELVYVPHSIFLGSEVDITEIAAAFRKVQKHYTGTSLRPLPTVALPEVTTASDPITLWSSTNSRMKPIRFGIIGTGMMGGQHARVISQSARMSLVGVSDADAQRGREAAAKFGCKWFASSDDLIASEEVDAIVIATPHWKHAELCMAALRAGLHVICEKPLAVTVAQADEVIRVASESPGLFAIVYQTRFEAAYRYAKKLVDSGQLGSIYRCSMIGSSWYTQAYYQSSRWRGTWAGEGGGVLLNQAPHVLDRYAWMCGMPETVTAYCDTSLHEIEVEDTASAILRHANGAHGYLHVSTNECPAISRTDIACDRGRITIENGRVWVTKLSNSIKERTVVETRPWPDLESDTHEIHVGASSDQDLLNAFYDDFEVAVVGNRKLMCPGEEGRNALELANAMILSSYYKKPATLPLDRREYTEFIARRVDSRGSPHSCRDTQLLSQW